MGPGVPIIIGGTALVLIAFSQVRHKCWQVLVDCLGLGSGRDQERGSTEFAPPQPVQEPAVLSLIVPFRQAPFAEAIRTRGRLDEEQAQSLGQVFTWSWYGPQAQFQNSDMVKLLVRPQEGLAQESDVFCFAIDLDHPDARFAPQATLLDQREAFAELHRWARRVSVSSQLPLEALRGMPFQHV